MARIPRSVNCLMWFFGRPQHGSFTVTTSYRLVVLGFMVKSIKVCQVTELIASHDPQASHTWECYPTGYKECWQGTELVLPLGSFLSVYREEHQGNSRKCREKSSSHTCLLLKKKKKKKKKKTGFTYEENFQQMIRCKGVLLRKDWRIINLLLVSGLQEDGPG